MGLGTTIRPAPSMATRMGIENTIGMADDGGPHVGQQTKSEFVDSRTTLIPCGDPSVGPSAPHPDEDISHSYEHPVAWAELGDDPARYLVAGPDRAGNLIELVVLAVEDGVLVIHAMTLRRSTQRELFGGERS